MNLSLFLLTTFVLRINLLQILFGFGIYSSVSLSRSCCAFWALGNLNINGDIFINDWLDFDVHSVVGCWYDERRFKFRCTKIAWTLIISTRHELFSSSLERRGEHHSQYDVLFFTINLTERVEQMNVWVFEHSNNAEHRAFVHLNHCWASIQYQWANWTHKGAPLMPTLYTYVIWLLHTCNTRSWCFDYK